MMNEIKLFAPATVANISCGFDILGLCLDSVGDEMTIRKSTEKGVRIISITGQNLPLETNKNVAGVAVLAMLDEYDSEFGFEIEIEKNIKPGSGIGSSAASSAGAVFGVNELLGKPFSNHDLVRFAMEGERLASGTAHADNVAPALLGNFTLVRSYNPLDIIEIPSPKNLYVSIIHPQIEVKTSDARSVLKKRISLQKTIIQMGNLGGLVAGLFMNDYTLIGRSLHDEIVEPLRSILIPSYDKVKENAIKTGALGAGISGSGPSIFALSEGEENAINVGKAMNAIYNKLGVDFDIHISKINTQGVKILQTK